MLGEDGRQRLLWFTPAVGTPAMEQFELLSVIGTQDLTPKYGRGWPRTSRVVDSYGVTGPGVSWAGGVALGGVCR
ncbi:hypothetical protein GCM10022207_52190 [Streptomyces lannensis]|uniref:Uncharacterized protein n=1 Tax=Streptomyces lannensis TaxID=766498 RepID=A0ABP7KJ26_9ACTN